MASEDVLNGIISRVVSTISQVTGIGKVHPYMRWAISDADFTHLAVTGGRVNIWQVTRTQTEERWLTTREIWRAHTLAIYGAYGLLDSENTEATFQALVERVAARFRRRTQLTLNETVESLAAYHGGMAGVSVPVGAIAGVQIQSVDHRTYHNQLVHWGELKLGVQEAPQIMQD